MSPIFDRRSFLAGCAIVAMPRLAVASPALTVVATTGMIADAVRRVGGPRVDVRALMGPGVDPHGYRQTRSDIVAMAKADVVIWNGLFLEAQLEDTLDRLAQTRRVVAAAEAVPPARLKAHADYEDRFDPHVWMDPELWAFVVTAVRDALSDAAPGDADSFARNADEFARELVALREYMVETLGSVPKQSRILVTAHDAFGYFGDAFGFEVAGIQGISTESEAGLKRIADLVDLLVERQIGAVFVESSVSDRNVRALIEGAAARGHDVKIGGELYSDAMGAEGTYEGTYVGMLDHNATVISRALGGSAPESGMSGLLRGA